MIDPLLFNVKDEDGGKRIEMRLSDNRPSVVQFGEGRGGGEMIEMGASNDRLIVVYLLIDPLLFDVEKRIEIGLSDDRLIVV